MTTPSTAAGGLMIDVNDLKKEVIRRFKSNDLEFPMLPQIATKIMKLSSDPDSSLQDFTDVIKTDQYISGQIVKIANSPVYGGLCDVTNLTRAIVQIGIRTIKDLILGISMGSTIFRNPKYQEEMDALWRHSMSVAFISQELAVQKKIDSEYAFLCGLVHDIGKPFLIDIIVRIMKKQGQNTKVPHEQLVLILDQLHQPVGGILARVWKFTDSVLQTVSHHHDFTKIEGEPRKMGNLVYVADRIAHQLDLGFGEVQWEIDFDDAIEQLQISGESIRAMTQTLPEQVLSYLDSITFG